MYLEDFGAVADLFYRDPLLGCFITDTEGRRIGNCPRSSIPDVHRTGLSFDTVRDGWEFGAQAAENNSESWDDDTLTDNGNDDLTCEGGI